MKRPPRVRVRVAEDESVALIRAADMLRWLAVQTKRGWSHAAVNPQLCDVWAERLDELYFEARMQLKSNESTVVEMQASDAGMFRAVSATVDATDGDGFKETVADLLALAERLDERLPVTLPRRKRRSVLAEP